MTEGIEKPTYGIYIRLKSCKMNLSNNETHTTKGNNMKRTIEIDDTLDDTVQQCICELKSLITEFIDENPDKEDICLSNDINYSGAFNEMIDGNTPIYTKEIDDLHYLYSYEFQEAYNNAGIYDEMPKNYKQVSIYLYLEEECWEWWNENSEDFIEEYKESLLEKDKETNGT